MGGLVFLIIVVLLLGVSSLRIVRNHERGVIEQFGKFNRILEPGLNFVLPMVQVMRRVDVREKVIDVPPQEVITKDNVVVTVDAVIYFQITDPRKVLYNIDNFGLATQKLAQTNLRNVVGDLELDQTLTSREKINNELRLVLDQATDDWGVRITRVEIQKIDPPRDITEAMSSQMKAERERRARILEAEGVKQSAILRAEGQKQADILKAEGEAAAIRQRAEAERDQKMALAEGEARGIEVVFNAIHEGGASADVLAIKYLESLGKIAEGQATKIFLPIETNGVLSSMAALGEAFREGAAPARLTGNESAASAAPLTAEAPTDNSVQVARS
ncbi:MAG: SPFH/Band 7/PHB domain protein [Armatimonadetes bacterium]|nr:SPFH/Band 7/PHB domain protein [Armatimonadota bacterium]